MNIETTNSPIIVPPASIEIAPFGIFENQVEPDDGSPDFISFARLVDIDGHQVCVSISGFEDSRLLMAHVAKVAENFPKVYDAIIDIAREFPKTLTTESEVYGGQQILLRDARQDFKLEKIVYFVSGEFSLWYDAGPLFDHRDLNVEFTKDLKLDFFKLDG